MSNPEYLFDPKSKRVLRAGSLRPATPTEVALAGYDVPPLKTASKPKGVTIKAAAATGKSEAKLGE